LTDFEKFKELFDSVGITYFIDEIPFTKVKAIKIYPHSCPCIHGSRSSFVSYHFTVDTEEFYEGIIGEDVEKY